MQGYLLTDVEINVATILTHNADKLGNRILGLAFFEKQIIFSRNFEIEIGQLDSTPAHFGSLSHYIFWHNCDRI